jgi:hypothetical protein
VRLLHEESKDIAELLSQLPAEVAIEDIAKNIVIVIFTGAGIWGLLVVSHMQALCHAVTAHCWQRQQPHVKPASHEGTETCTQACTPNYCTSTGPASAPRWTVRHTRPWQHVRILRRRREEQRVWSLSRCGRDPRRHAARLRGAPISRRQRSFPGRHRRLCRAACGAAGAGGCQRPRLWLGWRARE